jgi:hypothetical protein
VTFLWPILAPTPPLPPAAPTPPRAPVPGSLSDDPDRRVRELAKLLLAGKRDDAKAELEQEKARDPARLDALEHSVIALAHGKLAKQAYDLRRVIRFVRNPPKAPPPVSPQATIPSRSLGPPDSTLALDGFGAVTLHIGRRDGDFLLTYTGRDATDMRWLQFIWRMVELEFSATGRSPRKVALKMRADRFPGIPFQLTVDPKEPRWFTDTSKDGEGFFEQDSTVKRSGNDFLLYDAPSALPAQSLAVEVFKLGPPPDKMVAHFRAATYLIHELDVLFRADIHLTWDFTKSSSAQSPVNVLERVGKAVSELEPEHRACLLRQHPDIDYLPGKLIGPPQRAYAFDAVPDLAPSGWDTKNDLERYVDVAELAHAEWIVDSLDISLMQSTFDPADVNPRRRFSANFIHAGAGPVSGLNFSGVAVEGQTGFLDAQGAATGLKLPVERQGKLPEIAIELGKTAFQLGSTIRDKAFSVSTLRHEMTHAAHEQLAIGWLLKWRDELTSSSFAAWLAAEHDKGRIGEVDFAVVSTFISDPVDRRATELLSWIEGFVTALPFLPAKPDFHAHMLKEGNWPGAVSDLRGAGKFYDLLGSSPPHEAVKAAYRKRLRGVFCNQLTQPQRDALITWIRFLQKPEDAPDVPKVRTADEDAALKLIKGFSSGFLKDVGAQVEKPCP